MFLLLHTVAPVVLSGSVSAACAVVSNFLLNDRLTWPERRNGSQIVRALKYAAGSLAGLAVNLAVLAMLADHAHVDDVLANLAGVVCAMSFNYVVSLKWTWSAVQPGGEARQPLHAT